MSARLVILHSLLLAALWACCQPAAVADLYTGEAVVTEDRERLTETTLSALNEVLTRLTGITDRSVVEELGVTESQLRLLVLSEQRIRRQRPGPGGEGTLDEVRLRVDFDPVGVDRLLATHNLPRLGRERPAVLLWMAVEQDFEVQLQGDAELEFEIVEQARRLGLDVIRPLGDLMDLADMETFDIRGGFLDSADPSARRYGAGVTAMLDLRERDEGWSARWFWRMDGRDDGVQYEVDEAAAAVESGLERILAAVAERFAVAADAEPDGNQRVIVGGIGEEAQYAEVLRYLNSLGAVSEVRVLAARGRDIEFELVLASAGLEDALAIGGVLALEGRRADGSLLLRLLR